MRYKKSAISETKRLLDENDLKDLLNRRQFEEYIERIEGAARAGKNLLYLATPTSGDISVLYEDKLDKEEFCKAFYDLLFGDGDSPERVGKFSDYLESCELPNRWTFATYFLYLLNPEHDLFVKPRTTTWFLQFTDANESLPSTPNQQDYELILSLSEQLKLALSAYGATDMVAVQSFMWVAKQVDTQPVISEVKLREFKRLYRLFYVDYLHTEKGEEHIENRHQSRVSAQENHKLILEAVKEGKDITDLVILKYLPYNNTKTHRDQGAWISIAPAITSDVRKWYEANNWTDPDDWPKVALAILDFVNNCLEHPDNLP